MDNSKKMKDNLPKGLQWGVLDDNNLFLLVNFKRETNKLDYKITFNISEKKNVYDFVKDVSAFANVGGGYLVIGVEPKNYKVIGINKEVERNLDPTRISQTLSKYICPSINLHTYVGDYKEHNKNYRIGLIYIPEFSKRPHFINGNYSYKNEEKNKDIVCLHEGTIFVRTQSASKPINTDSWEELLERYYQVTLNQRKINFGKKEKLDLFNLDRKTFFEKTYKELKMGNYDFTEKIRTSAKEIKIHWERLLAKCQTEGKSIKDDVRTFKSEILIPILDKISDLSVLILERKRVDLYPEICTFIKNIIDYSTIYQRQKGISIGFNFSSETEHLSSLLPAYEATVRMYIIGSIAVAENVYDFVSLLGDQQVISHIDSKGRKVYLSIFFIPWFTSGYGAGNLTTFFEDAKKKLSNDKILKERYFSSLKDSHIDALCQFDFLQCVKLVMLNQNTNDLGHPRFPNFGRYEFQRIEDIIEKFIKKDKNLIKSFPIAESEFKTFLSGYVEYILRDIRSFGLTWRLLPEWFKNYISQ